MVIALLTILITRKGNHGEFDQFFSAIASVTHKVTETVQDIDSNNYKHEKENLN